MSMTGYICHTCKNLISSDVQSKAGDGEPQFCCDKCKEDYLEKYGRYPRGILQNY
jgi:hypothetical protein